MAVSPWLLKKLASTAQPVHDAAGMTWVSLHQADLRLDRRSAADHPMRRIFDHRRHQEQTLPTGTP